MWKAAPILPALTALCALFIAPIGVLGIVSFYQMAGPGTVGDVASLENYQNFLSDSFYLRIIGNTFLLGGLVVFFCLLIGYPVSYALARSHSSWRGFLLFLVVSPLLVSSVVRSIGWFPILSNEGLINWSLMKIGLISTPLPLISNFTGIVIGLVNASLPFMILTLVTVIQRIGFDLEEAAASLGASPMNVFFRVVVPLSVPGAAGGALIVFSMAIAAYTTPVIMGGNRTLLMATFIAQQFRTVLDYALGATTAVILLVLVTALSLVAARLSREGGVQAR